jgi:hypothetical protein
VVHPGKCVFEQGPSGPLPLCLELVQLCKGKVRGAGGLLIDLPQAEEGARGPYLVLGQVLNKVPGSPEHRSKSNLTRVHQWQLECYEKDVRVM